MYVLRNGLSAGDVQLQRILPSNSWILAGREWNDMTRFEYTPLRKTIDSDEAPGSQGLVWKR